MPDISPYYVLSFIIMAAYWITIISVIVVVITENRNPVRSLAWVTVLLFLPVVGLIIYIFFGRSIKNEAMLAKMKKRKLLQPELVKQVDFSKLPLSDCSLQQIRLAHSLMGAVYYPGNDIDIYIDGEALFKQLKDLTESSISSIVTSKSVGVDGVDFSTIKFVLSATSESSTNKLKCSMSILAAIDTASSALITPFVQTSNESLSKSVI